MHPLLVKGYSKLPVWAQNAAITAFGVRYRSHRLGGSFRQYVEGFRERERWPAERMQAYVLQELRRILQIAWAEVPFYRETWAASGVEAGDLTTITLDNLHLLPEMSKEQLRTNPDSLVARSIAKGQGGLSRNPSSGSTGTPTTVIWTSAVRRKCIAAREVRSFGWAGATILGSRSMIGGRPVVQQHDSRPPYYRYNYIERQVYFSAYHLSPDRAANYVEGLNRYRPRVLTGYAHCYYFLARHMLEQGLRLDYCPDALVLSSEALSVDMKKTMLAAFGARAFEEYGATENCVLATECEQGNLHISSDLGIVELLSDDGRPVPPGEPGRIVCTGLLNDVQPLVRYQIGDLATWSKVSCSCGRDGLPVIQSVEGRLEDVVVGPDGREMVRFHSVFINLPNVVEGQVIQEKVDRLVVKVVGTASFTQADTDEIRRRVTGKLGRVSVTVDRVESIPRNHRGKFRAVISLLSDEERRRVKALAHR